MVKPKKYTYGDRLHLKALSVGKPKIAFIVSKHPEDEYLVKLSKTFPYVPGRDEHFFVHREILRRQWRQESEGVQIKLF